MIAFFLKYYKVNHIDYKALYSPWKNKSITSVGHKLIYLLSWGEENEDVARPEVAVKRGGGFIL